jgi:hypothetical protein
MSATYIPVIMDLVDKIISEDRKDTVIYVSYI